MRFTINKHKKHLIECEILILILLITACLPSRAIAQMDKCSKPKVAVVMEVPDDEALIKHLNEQYPSQPKGSWLYEIQEKVLEELRMNSPGTQFITATEGVPNDCDYYFRYSVTLIGAGKDIEVAELKRSEYVAYYMSSTLAGNSACGIQNYILKVAITDDNRDIFKTIEQNISAIGNVGERIRNHEESHPVPPRGPEMKVSQERDYVSPLEEERKLKIKIDVTNCKGEPVYDPNHGQSVILPKKTERGELEYTHSFPEGCISTGNTLTLIIQKPKGASATYTLKKGMNAEKDPIKILTCGIDKKAKKETKIQIHGLEIKVKPEKKVIFPGDKTKIIVELSRVDEKGARKPVGGKHIQIKVKGLLNGHIHPSGDIITRKNGKAVLTYDAGDKDRKVVVRAKFQPEDYPDFVKDESAITVGHYKGMLEMSYTSGFACTEGSATVLVSLGKEDSTFLSGPEQMSVYYPVESITIKKAKAINKCAAGIGIGQEFHPYYEIPLPPGERLHLLVLRNSVSGKITHLLLNSCGPCIVLEYACSDGSKAFLGPTITDEDYIVTGGDGIHNASGGQGMIHWDSHWRKSH